MSSLAISTAMTTNSSNLLAVVPHELAREAYDLVNDRAKLHLASSPLEKYNSQVLKTQSWVIAEQPVKVLPRSLTELISMHLRDEGNALIEETRHLNNLHVGESFRQIHIASIADLTFIDLRGKLLKWAEQVINEVYYKHRRQFKEDPFGTYLKHHHGYISYIDQKIAHGDDHLYSALWARVLDAIPYWLLDRALQQPGKAVLSCAPDETGRLHSTLNLSPELAHRGKDVFLHLNLYGAEPTFFCESIILRPLLGALANEAFPEPDVMQQQLNLMMGDILEATPYLMKNRCYEEYLFNVPGTTCVGGFLYLSQNGIGQFCFSENRKYWVEGHAKSFYRGILELDFFGVLTFYMHPWRSLERVFCVTDALKLTYWFLKQVHTTVVQEYLRVEKYYLTPQPALTPEDPEQEDLYVPWQRPAVEHFEAVAFVSEDADSPRGMTALPQLRRSKFFKILNNCGVRIEQGKGSEIKLLKDGAHPFRLGNHYGPNPTVPYFLVDSILKRMQISPDEWRLALAAG